MVAGTSTGAIIAGTLAIKEKEDSIYPQFTAYDIVKLYKKKNKQIFIKNYGYPFWSN